MAELRPGFEIAAAVCERSFTRWMFLTSSGAGDGRSKARLTGAGALATQPVMNDLSQDAWFYAQNGAKGGPVGFADLQRMAREGKLNPRQDLIWAKGMESWQAAGEIQGLFERRAAVEEPAHLPDEVPAPEMPAAPAAAVDESYQAPDEADDYGWVEPEAASPGARRRSYLFFLLVFPVLWLAVTAAAGNSLGRLLGRDELTLVVSGLLVLPMLVALVFSVLRLVNLGMSGWWFLGNFVPLLNLWVGYRCFACPPGYAVHKKMDGAGIILAILYWLLVLVGVASLVALVGIVFMDMGSEKLRDQIVDPIKEVIRARPNP